MSKWLVRLFLDRGAAKPDEESTGYSAVCAGSACCTGVVACGGWWWDSPRFHHEFKKKVRLYVGSRQLVACRS